MGLRILQNSYRTQTFITEGAHNMTAPLTKARSHWPLVILSTIPALLGVLLPLILVRIVTPTEVGTFKIFFLYLGIAPALSLTSGLRSGLAYWSGQESQRSQAFAASSLLNLILAITATIVTLALADEISIRFQVSTLETTLFALALLGAIGGNYFEEAAIAMGRIWTGALFYCGSEILRTVVIIFALLYWRSLTAVLIAHTAISTLKLFAGYLWGYHLGLVGFPRNRDIFKGVWRYALPVSLAYVFGVFIGSADQFLLAPQVGPVEFALYSIGCLTVAPLLSFEQSVTRVLIPQMAEALSKKDLQRATLLYQSAVNTLAFILIPAVTGLLVFATPIIELLFTTQYSAAAQYLQLFALSYALLIVPHDALARARGESGWILKTFIVFALTSFLLCYLLIPLAGPVGALSGVLISGTAMRLNALRYFRKEVGRPLSSFFPARSIMYYIVLSLVLALVTLYIRPYFTTSRTWLFESGVLFSTCYLLLALPVKNRADRLRKRHRNVLIVSQSLRIGGLERMILNLSKQLQAEGRWNVRVFAYNHSDEKQTLVRAFRDSNIPVDTFKKKPGFSFKAVGRMLHIVYRNDIDIIHSHDLGTLIYAVIVKLCSFGKTSVVHTQHSFPQTEDTLRYRLYRYIATLWVDRLSVVSENIRRCYSPFLIKRTPIHVIENGVEFASEPITQRDNRIELRRKVLETLPSEQRQNLEDLLDELWMIYQARFYPGKGQDHALSLWQEMSASERRRSVLCLIGPESGTGEYQRIRTMIQKCPEQDRIFLIEGTTAPLRWLQAGDLFLSCSEYEGMPLAPLEAAGSGMPLLLSRIPGHSFLKENSLQFSLDNVSDGARHIHVLFDQIVQGGRSYQDNLWEKSHLIREKFSVAEMATRYSQLYTTNLTPPRLC